MLKKKSKLIAILLITFMFITFISSRFILKKVNAASGSWAVGTSGVINVEQCTGTGADNWMMDKVVFLVRPINLSTFEQTNGRTKMIKEVENTNAVYTVGTVAMIPYDFTQYLERVGLDDLIIMRRVKWNSKKINYYSDEKNMNAVKKMTVNANGAEKAFKDGVYYEKLKELNDKGTLSKSWKSLITSTTRTSSNTVWSWITRLDSSANKYFVTERIDEYLHIEELGINPDKMSEASSEAVTELKLRYIDLLMTIYSQIQSSVAETYWESSIEKYISGIYGTEKNSCNIIISAGFIARGVVNLTDENGKTFTKTTSMLGGCQDLLDFALGIESNYSLGTVESSQTVADALVKESKKTTYYNRLLKSLQLSVKQQSGQKVTRTYTVDSIFGAPIVSRIIANKINISGTDVSYGNSWNSLNLIEHLKLKSAYYGTMLVPAYDGTSELPKLEATLDIKSTLKGYEDTLYIKYKEQVSCLNDSPRLSITLGKAEQKNGDKLWEQFLNNYKYTSIQVEFTQWSAGANNLNPPALTTTYTKYIDKAGIVDSEQLRTFLKGEEAFWGWNISSLKKHPIGPKEYQKYSYQAVVTLYYSNTTKDTSKMSKLTAKTNTVTIKYLNTKDGGGELDPDPVTPTPAPVTATPTPTPTPTPQYGVYTSEPDAYSELKEGSIYNETFEAMAGVPTTRTLYFASGGSEFMVEVEVLYDYDKTATRTYRSYFAGGVDCEFKEADNAKTATLGGQTVDLHNGGTYTKTWTGSIPNKATAVTKLHSATCTAVPDLSAYNAAKAEAQAFAAEVNGTTLSYTSGSDKETRSYSNWGAKITTDSKTLPKTTTASVPCVKQSAVVENGVIVSPAIPCANEMATAQPGAAGTYTITVTWTVPAHVICGPCCSHVLTESVEDTWTQEVTFDTLKITDVRVWKIDSSYVGGMQEITYDDNEYITATIKQGDPNIFYNIASEDTSAAGRLRYSLQQGQHDAVTWFERNSSGIEKRTNKCNGMSGTLCAQNPIPVAANQGHNNSWATGILYNNTSYSNTVDYHKTAYSGLKSGLTSDSTDEIDKKTEEYQRFNERRNQQNTVTVVSDMLILQTSSGDQAVVYFEAKETATSQTNFKDIDITFETMWDNNSLSASNWTDSSINVGSYNGKYYETSSKYTGTGNNAKIATAFDNDLEKSSGTDELGKARVVNSKTFTAGSENKSSPGLGQYRMSRPSALRLFTDGIKQDPTNPNGAYVPGQSYVYYRQILSYTDVEKATGDANVHEEDLITNDMNQYGYTIRSRYRITDSKFGKVNSIIVQNPVSVADATIISLPEEMDQRTTIPEGAAQSMLDAIASSQVCPLSPALCEYRVKNCKYFVDTVKGSFDFEKISSIDDDGNVIQDDTSIIRSLMKSSAGAVLEYQLPSGFSIKDDGNGFGTGRYLNISGKRLALDLSGYGLSYNKNARVKIEANVYIPSSSSDNMLFSFDGLGFYIPAGKNYGIFTTGNGEEKKVNFTITDKYIKLGIVFSFGSIDDCEVYIDDTQVTSYTTVNSSNVIDEDAIGYDLYIGAWTKNNNFKAEYRMDNMTITRMAGVNTHTNSCYDIIENHETVKEYTCGNKTNGVYDLNHVHTDKCTYRITEYNSHVHTGSVSIDTTMLQSALDKYYDGDGALLKAMLGTENYNKFVTADQNGTITGTGNRVTNFSYTGGVQKFTAKTAGTYVLEAWGAAGGDGVNNNQSAASHGGLGGYSSGEVYLNKGDSIYVYVGGKGSLASSLGTGGGYNGGGHAGPGGYGGGGMTHFSYSNTDSDYNKTLNADISGTVYYLYKYGDYIYAFDEDGKCVSYGGFNSLTLATAQASGTCLGTYSTDSKYNNGTLSYILGSHQAGCTYSGKTHVSASANGTCYGCNHTCTRNIVASLYKVSPYYVTSDPNAVSGTVKAMNFDLSKLLLVAGGGGGADNAGGILNGDDDGSGGYGGGEVAGNAKINGEETTYSKNIYTLSNKMKMRTGTDNVNGVAVTNATEEGVYGPYVYHQEGELLTITVEGENLTNGYPIVYTNYGETEYTTSSSCVNVIAKTSTKVIYEFTVPSGIVKAGTNTSQDPYAIWEFCYHASNTNSMKIKSTTVESGRSYEKVVGYTDSFVGLPMYQQNNVSILEKRAGLLSISVRGDNYFTYSKNNIMYGSWDDINGIRLDFTYTGSGTRSQMFYSSTTTFTENKSVWAAIQPNGVTFNLIGAADWSNNKHYLRFDLSGDDNSTMQFDITGINLLNIITADEINDGSGGTQDRGFSNGAGQSATVTSDCSGAGGGYMGGFVTNHSNGGSGGGSGYVGNVTNGKTISGNATMPAPSGGTQIGQAGNGYARITNPQSAATAADVVKWLDGKYDSIPATVNGACNPIYSCDGLNNAHVCTSLCTTIKVLNCTEPHHNGLCYDYDNDTCWDACCNDNNHKLSSSTVTKPDGETIDCGSFICLDNFFDIYFPNIGDFAGTGEYGIASLSINRGKGYVDNMDTTEWLREKRVRFGYDVLFNNNGTWEQVTAGEWVTLPIRNGDEVLEYYHFYCLLANEEAVAATVEFSAEAINCANSPGGKEDPYLGDDEYNADCENEVDNSNVTNKRRFSTYTAYHSAYKITYTDVVGRIGNLIVEDTEDLRFSNLFKESTRDNNWIIEGIVHEVDTSISKNYLAWFNNDGSYGKDIRGVKVDPSTEMYNTYGTQKWTSVANAVSLPLSGEKNTIESLRSQQLKAGYNILFDISTIGDYSDSVQVVPYFYALDIDTNTLTPVDVYMNISGEYVPINYFGLLSDYVNDDNTMSDTYYEMKDKLYDYVMTLNWKDEAARRNYTDEEEAATKYISDNFLEFITDDSGNVLTQKYVTIPYGDGYALGTTQMLLAGTRARTFIGSSKVNTVNINGGTETNINGSIAEKEFIDGAQRWHLTMGLPSSVAYVAYRNKTHLDPKDTITLSNGKKVYAIDEFTTGNVVILMTADIKALGTRFTLGYDQGANNGVLRINGKKYSFGNDIPTLLGVYECSTSSTIDIDFVGTH